MTKPAIKRGARNSAKDAKAIQDMHDLSHYLGAMCASESANAKATARANGKSASVLASTSVAQAMLPARIRAVKALSDVSVETWDVQNACQVLAAIMNLVQSEAYEGEPNDVGELVGIAEDVLEFIAGELAEISADLASDPNYVPEDESAEPPMVDIPSMEEAVAETKAISKREDVNPKEGTSQYGDVKFADEKNKKYPIDTEAHIRAAYNYISKPDNASKYSADEVKQIKAKIVSAWKDKIDKAGPPSAEGKSTPSTLNFSYIKSLHLPHDEQYFRDVVAVKSIGTDRIRGYLALWGDPGLVDVELDFFTGKSAPVGATNFWDDVLPLPKPLTWDHAQDPATKSAPVIGTIDGMGDDDTGRWYESQLDRNYKYRKAIDRLISERVAGTSSDSVPQYVQRERTKSGSNWLKAWPLIGAALTPTPCEPRMFDAGSLYWKSIGVDLARLDARTGIAGAGAGQRTIADLTRLHESLREFAQAQQVNK